jgi:hypothetical protein
MEIISFDTLAEAQAASVNNAYIQIDGTFYRQCYACGKLVEVDHHRTRQDLLRERDFAEDCFCADECRKKWLSCNFSTLADASACGYGEDWIRFFGA